MTTLADELERLAKALFDEPDAARRIYRSVALSLWVENNLPRIISALRREEPASLTREGEPVAWVCEGCGHPCRDPVADLAGIRAAGKVSCCPERKMQTAYTRPVAWPEGYKLVPVEPTEAMLAAARVAPTNSFRSHGPHYSDYASIYAAMLSASDGAGTEGGAR